MVASTDHLLTGRRRSALAELHAAHDGHLRAFAVRRTSSSHRADELVAETWVVAWRRFEAIPIESPLRWLCGVLIQLERNDHRGRRRYRRVVDLAVAEAQTRPLVTSLDADLLLTEQQEVLVAAFLQLDEPDRDVLGLATWGGLRGGDLAAALDVEEATARKRLSRARVRLRRAYTAMAELSAPDSEWPTSDDPSRRGHTRGRPDTQ